MDAPKISPGISFSKKIEIEVETLSDAVDCVSQGADIVMLDNMNPDEVKEVLEEGIEILNGWGPKEILSEKKLETAVGDLEHYRENGSAVLVLCGSETRARNMLRLLEEREIPVGTISTEFEVSGKGVMEFELRINDANPWTVEVDFDE